MILWCLGSVTENGAAGEGHFCRGSVRAVRANLSILKITPQGTTADTAGTGSSLYFFVV